MNRFQRMALRYVVALPLCGIACIFSNDMALAQLITIRAGCSGDATACPAAAVIGAQGNFEIVKNQPYEAQAITEINQTLADGSHITQTARAMIARDSDGRTVRTQTLSKGTTVTTIFDPIAKTHIDYTSDTKIAHVMTLPTTFSSGATGGVDTALSGATVSGPTGGAVNVFFVQAHRLPSQVTKISNTTTESLGTKTIDGIEVVGTRSTSTIPAGTIGNDKDLTITREAWHSQELKLDVLNIQDDPRFGQSTYSLTNIQCSEPEAALFQVPPDYKIEKISMPESPR
ncbi:MAG: hypothetical protein ACRD28_05900 [Acidobacteriaceae bacterium]